MPKALVVEDVQFDHVLRVTKTAPETGTRNSALLLVLFGTGLTASEVGVMEVRDYLEADGRPIRDGVVRPEIAYNHRKRPLCWVNRRVLAGLDAYLAERVARGFGVTANPAAYRGLDPRSALFVGCRAGEQIAMSRKVRDGKTYYSATQFTALVKRLFEDAGVEGVTAQAARRTLAVKLRRKGIDLRHISEILGIQSLTATKRLAETDPVRLGELIRTII